MWYASNLSAGLLKGNENLVLCNDIDMKGFELSSIDAGNKGFRGSLDGQLHTVSNLIIEGAGLFTRLGLGSSVKNIGFINARIRSDKDAGVVAGGICAGAVVRIEGVSVINSEIESTGASAGSIIGSTDGGVDTNFISCVCDGVKVTGEAAGAIAGVGNSCVMKNVFANATLTGSSTGTLATHSSSFSAENCGYGKLTVAKQRDGKAYDTKSFESGEIAYILNTFGASKRFGITDGKTSVSVSPASVVRIGGMQYYTTNVLGASADTEAYFLTNGKLVIVHKQTAKDRLVDAKITVAGKEVEFSSFALSRYAECTGEYYVAHIGWVLYVIETNGTEAPALTLNGVTLAITSVK